MENYLKIIGIDISKNSLDLCSITTSNTKEMQYDKIENNVKSISKFLKNLKQEKVLFCMEDTGIYGMLLYQVFTEKGIDFSVVPSIQIKRSKGLQRGKSDKIDARDIAKYALLHLADLKLYELPELDFQELRILLAERDRLVKAIKLFGSTAESTIYANKKTCKLLNKSNEKTMKFLKQQLKDIEVSINELIQNNEQMQKQNELLQSIPGVGPQTALLLIAYTRCFTAFDNWRQLACYSGIAPFPYQSGISVKGRTKVSHFAQKKLKSIIHMSALVAKTHDHELKQYYDKKLADGKHKMSIMNAIRCKVIARAFAVINRQTPYVNIQKFAA